MATFTGNANSKGFVTLSWDMKEFSDALKLYEQATQKEMSDVINQKAQRVCMGAAAMIPKAQARADRNSGLWNALATGKTSKGINKLGQAVKGKGNKKVAMAIYASRGRAYGYGKALWRKLAQDLGKSLNSKFNIKHANAEKAVTGVKSTARMEIIGIEQSHIDQFMQPALEKSMGIEAKSMVEYATFKLAKIAAQRSGRKMK